MKKHSIKIISLILILSIFLTACSNKPVTKDGGLFKAGTYKAEADGIGGPVKVEVTVTDNEITKIIVTEHSETPGISDGAIEQIPELIVSNQSLGIDVVSGATMTSNAILAAVEKALTEAGANIDALKVKKEEVAKEKTKGEDQNTEIDVVGAGAGGFGSSIEAARLGKKVVLLEKMPLVGGSTILSEGYLWSSGSKMNKEYNVGFEPQAMKEY